MQLNDWERQHESTCLPLQKKLQARLDVMSGEISALQQKEDGLTSRLRICEFQREQAGRDLNKVKQRFWFSESGDVEKLKAQLEVEFREKRLLIRESMNLKPHGSEVTA